MAATDASAKRKRGSAPISPPSDGRVARRPYCGSSASASAATAAAAEQKEPPALVPVEGQWATFMVEQREEGHFVDVTLVAGGQRIQAHRTVLVGLSSYLKGLLTSGLAESVAQRQELTLEGMDGRAVEAVVDCMYSGKLALSPHTVTAVIRVANLLQIGAVEQVAGEFFVSRLEPSAAADALGFAAGRGECGQHAKKLLEKCTEYAIEHFAAVSRMVSFLSLPGETVAALIGSDDLPVEEPDVVSAVRSWFDHDAARRKGALSTLMPLIRWPRLPVEARRNLSSEPLFEVLGSLNGESRRLSFNLMLECGTPDPRECILAAGCPRLKRRKGTAPPVPTLAFTAFSTAHYQTHEDGALVESTDIVHHRTAMCSGHVMSAGRSCAEFTVVHMPPGCSCVIGVGRPGLDVSEQNALKSRSFYGFGTGGRFWRDGEGVDWEGQRRFGEGDVLQLLLDSDMGTLTVKKNGTLLDTHTPDGLTGDLCWVATCFGQGVVLRIKGVDPAEF